MSRQASARGRPRQTDIDRIVMQSALSLLEQVGFRSLTLDAVAAAAGVGKMTIYRRWPNKAHVVMEAFLVLVSPMSHFPPGKSALRRLKLQMRLQVQLFAGHFGRLLKSLLGEAQFDEELAQAFRERWLMPRRIMTRDILRQAVAEGDLRRGIDIDAAIDLFYAPFYYRLQLGSGTLDEGFSDQVFNAVIRGLGSE